MDSMLADDDFNDESEDDETVKLPSGYGEGDMEVGDDEPEEQGTQIATTKESASATGDARLDTLVALKRQRRELAPDYVAGFSAATKSGTMNEFIQSRIHSHMIHLDSDIARLEAELHEETLPRIVESARIIIEGPRTANVQPVASPLADAIRTIEAVTELQMLQGLTSHSTKERQGQIRGARAAKTVILATLQRGPIEKRNSSRATQ